jgi:DNA-binding MarR family transcriptional regulator
MTNDQPVRELSDADRLIHEPGRLAILTVLNSCHSADFVFLRSATKLSQGSLSQHLTKLEAARLITIEKSFRNKRPRTVAQLTDGGRQALDEYWRRLEEWRQSAAGWWPQLEPVPQE